MKNKFRPLKECYGAVRKDKEKDKSLYHNVSIKDLLNEFRKSAELNEVSRKRIKVIK